MTAARLRHTPPPLQLCYGRKHAHNALQELAQITDEMIYNELKSSDITMGRWTDEDPSLRAVQRWVRSRRG